MKYKTRKLIVRITALILVLALFMFIATLFTGCNRGLVDATYKFDTAIIRMPDGHSLEGKVERWIDFENSDMIQIKIGGKWYMTHSTNVVLISAD